MNALRRIGVGNTSVSGVRVMPLREPPSPSLWSWCFVVVILRLRRSFGVYTWPDGGHVTDFV